MSKTLEALERIKDEFLWTKKDLKDINTIEKALKRLESLEEELGTALNLNECQTVKEWVSCMKKKLKEYEKYKKVVAMLKDNISLDFTRYPQSGRYEVWLNNGDEEPILIADTKEDYELLREVFKK